MSKKASLVNDYKDLKKKHEDNVAYGEKIRKDVNKWGQKTNTPLKFLTKQH